MGWELRLPGSIGAVDTRVLLALMVFHAREGRATVRGVAAEARLPLVTTHSALVRLRDAGLVEWDQRRHATLRPSVGVAA